MSSDKNPNQAFSPARIVEVELSQALPVLPSKLDHDQQDYSRLLLLVRLHTRPLGMIELQLEEYSLHPAVYVWQIWQVFEKKIKQHLHQDGLPVPKALDPGGLSFSTTPICQKVRRQILNNPPLVSIIVATHNRTKDLSACLDSLLALDYPNFEIIVVDNVPDTDHTAEMVRTRYADKPFIRYIREDTPGLAIAHNRALQEVRGSIVALTDDDVLVDSNWLVEIMRAFRISENVGCVTGLILPFEMETPAQGWLEQFGRFGKGFDLRIFGLKLHKDRNSLFPYSAGQFGSGANMAFRTSALKEIGGFDPALGAGTPAMGGDDLAAFFDIVSAGYKLVYQPAAIVYHKHHREFSGLTRQAYGYGVGLMAYLIQTLINQPARVFDMLSKTPKAFQHILSPHSPKNKNKHADYPRILTRLERKGMLYGFFAYLYSRWKHRNFYPRSNRFVSARRLSVSAPIEEKAP